MTFDTTFPIITTADMAQALGFYRDLLGGAVSFKFPPEGDPEYVGVDIGSSHVGIGHNPERAGAPSDGFALWVYTDDCDAAVDHLRRHGVEIVEEPADQPWGERVARVRDPDGNMVIVGARPA